MDQEQSDIAYWKKEGLDQYFDVDPSRGANAGAIPIAPDVQDLARLHRLIRSRKCFTVLEFGVGYSSIIIADALHKNQADWDALPDNPTVRNNFMFQCFSVDTSQEWIAVARDRMPKHLQAYVHFHYSTVSASTYQGQMCHYYDDLPDIVPDFIYLDGPDPAAVRGKVNGMSWKPKERTVMAADILLMEPTLLPGTFILIDGRTNNARFLYHNFKRKYDYVWDRAGDVTTFELTEARLGKYNLLGSDFYDD